MQLLLWSKKKKKAKITLWKCINCDFNRNKKIKAADVVTAEMLHSWNQLFFQTELGISTIELKKVSS